MSVCWCGVYCVGRGVCEPRGDGGRRRGGEVREGNLHPHVYRCVTQTVAAVSKTPQTPPTPAPLPCVAPAL